MSDYDNDSEGYEFTDGEGYDYRVMVMVTIKIILQ